MFASGQFVNLPLGSPPSCADNLRNIVEILIAHYESLVITGTEDVEADFHAIYQESKSLNLGFAGVERTIMNMEIEKLDILQDPSRDLIELSDYI